MPSLDFEVWCGICGNGVCYDTEVEGTTLTVTCSTCKDRFEDTESEKDSGISDRETAEKALEEAQERIAELEQELIDKVTEYEGRMAAISYGYTKEIDTSIG